MTLDLKVVAVRQSVFFFFLMTFYSLQMYSTIYLTPEFVFMNKFVYGQTILFFLKEIVHYYLIVMFLKKTLSYVLKKKSESYR